MNTLQSQYDPNKLDEYLRAGRLERAKAVGESLSSLKELFTKKAEEPANTVPAGGHTAQAC